MGVTSLFGDLTTSTTPLLNDSALYRNRSVDANVTMSTEASSSDMASPLDTTNPRLVNGVVVLLLMIFNLGGNSLVFVVYKNLTKNAVFSLFVRVLAGLDLLTACTTMLIDVIMKMRPGDEMALNLAVMCKLSHFQVYANSLTSGCVLTLIAYQRYRKICHPLKNSIALRRAKQLLLAIGLACLAISTPTLLVYGPMNVNVDMGSGHTARTVVCRYDTRYEGGPLQVATSYGLLLAFGIVLTATIVLYVLVSRAIVRFERRSSRAHQAPAGGAAPPLPAYVAAANTQLDMQRQQTRQEEKEEEKDAEEETSGNGPIPAQEVRQVHAEQNNHHHHHQNHHHIPGHVGDDNGNNNDDDPERPVASPVTGRPLMASPVHRRPLKQQLAMTSETPMIKDNVPLRDKINAQRQSQQRRKQNRLSSATGGGDGGEGCSGSRRKAGASGALGQGPGNRLSLGRTSVFSTGSGGGGHLVSAQMYRVFAVITVVFIVSYLPHLVVLILTKVLRLNHKMLGYGERLLLELAYNCPYISTVANPLVYGFSSSEFRDRLREMMTCFNACDGCCCCNCCCGDEDDNYGSGCGRCSCICDFCCCCCFFQPQRPRSPSRPLVRR